MKAPPGGRFMSLHGVLLTSVLFQLVYFKNQISNPYHALMCKEISQYLAVFYLDSASLAFGCPTILKSHFTEFCCSTNESYQLYIVSVEEILSVMSL